MNVGLLLLTHNDIGAQLLVVAKTTYGSIPTRTEILSVDHYDQPIDLISLTKQYVKVLDEGKGVLIFRHGNQSIASPKFSPCPGSGRIHDRLRGQYSP